MIPQHQWASKLLGFDFAVEYKSGTLNIVTDTLSRRDEGMAEAMALSAPQFSLFDEIRQKINGSEAPSVLCDTIRGGVNLTTCSVVDVLIMHRGLGIHRCILQPGPDDSGYGTQRRT